MVCICKGLVSCRFFPIIICHSDGCMIPFSKATLLIAKLSISQVKIHSLLFLDCLHKLVVACCKCPSLHFNQIIVLKQCNNKKSTCVLKNNKLAPTLRKYKFINGLQKQHRSRCILKNINILFFIE